MLDLFVLDCICKTYVNRHTKVRFRHISLSQFQGKENYVTAKWTTYFRVILNI